MSEDSTRSTDGETAEQEQDRQHRAAELTAQAQALFSSGTLAGPDGEPVDEPDGAATDETDETDETEDGTEVEDELETEVEDEDGLDVPVVAVLTADAAGADEQADEAQGADEGPDEPASAFPSFGVVFQAPDLSDIPRRRSRRATSGVTTPQERPADEPAQPEQVAAEQDGAEDDDGTGTDESGARAGRRRRRGGKGRRRGANGDQPEESGDDSEPQDEAADAEAGEAVQEGAAASTGAGSRRRRGRRSAGPQQGADESADSTAPEAESGSEDDAEAEDDGSGSAGTRRRRRRRRTGESGAPERSARDEVTSVKGSTRLEAKRQRRREGREAGRRRTIITEAEFLARRESVDRVMVVRGLEDRTQIAVLEDGVPVEHYVSRSAQSTMAGNVYLGRVQNVLPSMEAAFVDIGKGRNAVLYAGEVNWDAAGLSSGEPKRIENALKAGESVLVQVTKDPIGHKGARLTSQISLPGRYLVYVPGNSMTGISRKLPDTERTRLKKILKEVVPEDAGVIVRTAAEGASEAELRADVERLTATWERISSTAKAKSSSAPVLLHGEPDMTVRVIRDVFTEDFSKLVVSGDQAWAEVKRYIDDVAPDLADRVEKYTGTADVFTTHRVHEAIAKAMDRKVWLPSGGSLVIDRTEAMTVVDVNTGKFTGSGGNLEETVTKNNIEAAEEIVRQLRLRDIGGIIVIDFIDMVLESNRDLVVRRLLECLGRDRTKHQVAEVTSLGLVQMTRKRVGSGLIEVFSETCAHCSGRGVIVQSEPVQRSGNGNGNGGGGSSDDASSGSGRRGRGKGRGGSSSSSATPEPKNVLPPPNPNGPTPAQIAAAAHAAALQAGASSDAADAAAGAVADEVTGGVADEVVPEAAAASDSGTAVAVTAADTPAAAVDTDPTEADATDPAGAHASGPAADTAQETAPAARASRSRGRASRTASTTPRGDDPLTPEQVETGAGPVAEAPPAPPKRRRRGRVVAPAGPPTGAADEAGQSDES